MKSPNIAGPLRVSVRPVSRWQVTVTGTGEELEDSERNDEIGLICLGFLQRRNFRLPEL